VVARLFAHVSLDRPARRPIAQARLDEAFGLAIRLWRVGFGADVLEPEPAASPAKSEGLVAGSVVAHHALHFDTEAVVVGTLAKAIRE